MSKPSDPKLMEKMPSIPPDLLAQIPRERDVVSFHHGMDIRRTGIVLKFLLKNNRAEVFHLPGVIANLLLEGLKSVIEKSPYKDVRRRKGDKHNEHPQICEFLKRQPDIDPADWDVRAGGASRQATGVQVHGFHDAIFIAFRLTAQEYKALRMEPILSFYLLDMLSADRDDGLVDLSKNDSLNTKLN